MRVNFSIFPHFLDETFVTATFSLLTEEVESEFLAHISTLCDDVENDYLGSTTSETHSLTVKIMFIQKSSLDLDGEWSYRHFSAEREQETAEHFLLISKDVLAFLITLLVMYAISWQLCYILPLFQRSLDQFFTVWHANEVDSAPTTVEWRFYK